MKHLKRFNESKFLNFVIGTYMSNTDGSIDVDGDVNLSEKYLNLKKLPITFNIVTGNFTINNNNLTNLIGCPKKVGGDFSCSENSLTSLEGCPTDIGGDFYCGENVNLTSLEHGPKQVGRNYYVNDNALINLIGAPVNINGWVACNGNNLTSLEGCPDIKSNYILAETGGRGSDLFCVRNNITSFKGIGKLTQTSSNFSRPPGMDLCLNIRCEDNPINEIYKLCPTVEFITYLNEFTPIRGNTILGKRLQECLYMCDIDLDVTKLVFKHYTLLE